MYRREILWLTFWITMTLWFGQGCQNMNVSNTPRHVDPLPVFEPDPLPVEFEGGTSVTSIDRSDWEPAVVTLSRDDLETRPTFTRSYVYAKKRRVRESGNYPTYDTALELSNGRHSTQGQFLEMVVDPFVQIGQILYAPIRLIKGERPRQINHGPAKDYELVPRTAPVDWDAASTED